MKKVFLKISLFKILVDLQAYLKKLALEKGTPSRVIPGKIVSFLKTLNLDHSHKKRKDNLETRAEPAVFSL